MGTRADFYLGLGKGSEWLGSVAWDGYQWEDDKEHPIQLAKTDDEFKEAVTGILSGREDAKLPSDGWPWPWDDSNTTDYAYCFDGTKLHIYGFGGERFINDDGDIDYKDGSQPFPNMSEIKNVQLGSKSGVIIISG